MQFVDEMTTIGWPKAWIADEIGQQHTPARQGRRLCVGNARKIREFWQRVGSITSAPR